MTEHLYKYHESTDNPVDYTWPAVFAANGPLQTLSIESLVVETAKMPLLLTHALESDMDHLMEVQFAAMAQEPYHHVLFPGPNTTMARARAGSRTLDDWRNDPSEQVLKVVETESGKIVSFGKWNVYTRERPKSEWDQHMEIDWTEDPVLVEGAETYLREIHGMRHKYATGQPHLRNCQPCLVFDLHSRC